ncbi:MAG: T9SS type A sorting domain-containing protein [Bacteroidetes bacterium]|nr:T9SS type A sorting domain-containing protein [Bacteroidota bacterium]
MSKGFLFFILFYLPIVLMAQSPKNRILSVPVQKGNSIMREPWAGGMNAPQFSEADINQDGIKDLFVFDRAGNRVMVYLGNGNGSNTDTAFEYMPKYESLFPEGMMDFALLHDYNSDNIPDIFTHTSLGTMVLKGSVHNGLLSFDTVSSLLRYQSGAFSVNIWTASTDIPLFADVNGDGDIDVLSYGVFGTTMSYYENQTKENIGNPYFDIDSFRYEEVTQCWGNVAQNSLNNSFELNIVCKGNLASPDDGSQRHAGNSLFGFDPDNDGDLDILNGNIGYGSLAFLKNCGTPLSAHICSLDSTYPSCDIPIHLPSYPAAYGFDADDDGREDLLIAPNTAVGSNDTRNVHYYHNTGNIACPMELVSDSFLVRHFLDFGTDSKPVFHDMNGDGIQDLIVGNYSYFHEEDLFKSSLAYLENIGTPTFPRFRLMTGDYDSLSKFNLVGMHPSFGDMDGDGLEDMIVGEVGGWLHFFKNTALSGASFPALTTPQYFNLKVNQFSAPFIFDVNGDSLNDLLVGRDDGKISYFWNFGTKLNPIFSPDSVNHNFGFVNVKPYELAQGFSAPTVIKDSADNLFLLIGSASGTVYQYFIDPTRLRSDSFPLIDSNYLKQDVGGKAVITFTDLNADGHLEYVLGNQRGGLMMFSDSLWDTSTVPFNHVAVIKNPNRLRLYPNPAKEYFVCEMDGGHFHQPVTTVYNLIGETIPHQISIDGNKMIFSLPDIAPGIYFIRISEDDIAFTGKILIQ